MTKSKSGQRINETLLKKRRNDHSTLLKSKKKDTKFIPRRIQMHLKRKIKFSSGEELVKDYRLQEYYRKRYGDQLKVNCGRFWVDLNQKLAFVILINPDLKCFSRGQRIALELLGLRDQFQGVFVRLNEKTIALLRLIDELVAWGYVDVDHVRTLMYHHAYLTVPTRLIKSDKENLPEVSFISLSSNDLVEKVLGHYDIICIEDIVEAILTGDESFKYVNAFLAPFELNPPKEGLRDLKKHFCEGGSFGNRGIAINNFIDRLGIKERKN